MTDTTRTICVRLPVHLFDWVEREWLLRRSAALAAGQRDTQTKTAIYSEAMERGLKLTAPKSILRE